MTQLGLQGPNSPDNLRRSIESPVERAFQKDFKLYHDVLSKLHEIGTKMISKGFNRFQ